MHEAVREACTTIFIFCVHLSISQCLTISSSIENQSCIGSTINISNTSSDTYSYLWDFCDEPLDPLSFSLDILATIPTPRRFLDLALAEDSGILYAFAISWQDDDVVRMTFGNGADQSPTEIVSLGSFGLIDQGVSINMINQGGVWYAIVYDWTGNLTRLDFSNGLDNLPIASLVASGVGGSLSKMKLAQSGSELKGVIINSNTTLTIVDFNGDITYDPVIGDITTSSSIPGTSDTREVEIFRECDQWYGFVSSFNSNTITRVDFGTEITSTIVGSTLLIGNEFASGDINRTSLIKSGGEYNLQVFTFDGRLFDVALGSDPLVSGLTSSSVTQYGISQTYAQGYAIDIQKIQGVWQGYLFDDLAGELYHVAFENPCPSILQTSSQKQPTGLSYSSSGNFNILLEATSINGIVDSKRESITILAQTAPTISYSSDYVCVSSPITFTPTTPGLSSYSWDFDGDGMEDSSLENPSPYSYASPGTYTVRIDVNDGTCTNFYEQPITIYPDPPVPSFTAVATECANTAITFTNTTDESQHTGVITYKWDFDNDGIIDSNDPNPSYAYTTAGLKTVILTDSIPGCSASSTPFNITINAGPIANFTASATCQGEAMQFTNTSTGAISYFWDFTDGFTSIQTNPSHIFTAAGNYFVELTATDSLGCDHTQIIEVAVSDSPQTSIDFDVPCTSAEGTQFFDLTTVDNADIVSRTWYVDNIEVSTAQNPLITFSTTGSKNIRLDVQSSNGCESSHNETIEVLSAPIPDFTASIGCQEEASTFNDNTTTSGNPIVSWLWTVEGVTYTTPDISHVFATAGFYDVTLEVTGQNFCSESITKTIEIVKLPTVDFSINGECDNQLITVHDQSSDSSDPVVSRRWMLDGAIVGNGSQLVLENLPSATHELELELETSAGCTIRKSEMVVINEAPVSSFASSRTYGLPGDSLTFTNTSSGAIANEWLLDGQSISTDPNARSIVFDQPGRYTVSLVSVNSLGCYDTATQEILIAIPEVDLAIGSFDLVQENNVGKIFMEIQNLSNLPVEVTEAQIVLENEFAVSEQIAQFIDVNETRLVSLAIGIPLSVSKPAYFCVSLSSQYVGYEDLNPVNNEKCLTIQPDVKVEDPFPNPVDDQFRLKVIAPASGTVTLTLINPTGKVLRRAIYTASEGLNNFFVEMSAVDPGIYHIVVDLLGTTYRRKVIKY